MGLTERQTTILAIRGAVPHATMREINIILEGRDFTQRVPLGRRRLAKLTPAEDAEWNRVMPFYQNEGYTDDDASYLAWHDLKDKFSRLRQFDGAQA